MKKLRELLYIYSEIFFTDNSLLGALILVVTFFEPNLGLCGLCGVIAAYAFSKLTFSHKLPVEPYYFYNPLLVGLSVGALFTFSFLTLFLVVVSAILSIVLTAAMGDVAKRYLGLPILSIPFVLVSTLVFILAKSTGFMPGLSTMVTPVYLQMPSWLLGYFRALAGIFFSQNVIVGIILAAGLLVHSRIIFLLTLIGYFTGAAAAGIFSAGIIPAYSDQNYFNFILTAIAVGGIYLVPSIRAYIISAVAVLITWFILSSMEAKVAHVFTLPFNIAVLCFIYYTGITNSKLRTLVFLRTPEANLDRHLNYTGRFGEDLPAIALPFSGEWKVSQAFDGEITHKGEWKYAVDFMLVDEKGTQFEGDPAKPESYFAFGKPVLAPVSGTVAAVVADVADNAIGSVNREQNWGNFVLIFDAKGFYVKVCHMKLGTVLLKPGMFVEAGQPIGNVGNSGYSPYPHIHVHVQKDATSPGETTEFRFEQVVLSGGEFVNKLLPQKGQSASSVFSSVKKKKAFELMMKDSFKLTLTRKRKGVVTAEREEAVEVVMDPFGRTYLESGRARLYFETHKNVFRFYGYAGPKFSALRYLFIAMPSLPLTEYKAGWNDFLPMSVSMNPVMSNLVLFIQSFWPGAARNPARLTGEDANTVACTDTMYLFGKELSRFECRTVTGSKFIESVHIKQGETEFEIKRKG